MYVMRLDCRVVVSRCLPVLVVPKLHAQARRNRSHALDGHSERDG